MDKVKLAKKISEELIKLFREVLAGAINVKSGTSLIPSNLNDQLEISDNNIEIYTLLINDYIDSIESGRKPGREPVPIQALIDWMKRKHISNDNRVAYAIQHAIVRDGIPPRNIFQPYEGLLDANWENLSDRIFEEIIEELNNVFKD